MTKDEFALAIEKMEAEEQYKLMEIIFEIVQEEIDGILPYEKRSEYYSGTLSGTWEG